MMAKTDNHNPKAKLDLRRYFMKKYHTDSPPSVFDCCQGSAVMWTQLKKEFEVSNYWGVDLKPKKGRLKIDSVRILQQPGWSFDVVDVDTYGSPWKHWLEVVKNAKDGVTVFLTIGKPILAAGGRSISKIELDAVGLNIKRLPSGLAVHAYGIAVNAMLAKALSYGTITEAVEAVSTGNARYIGVHLEPIKKDSLPAVDAASKPKHTRTKKELRA
jgi:hypothetical protein